MPIFRDEKDAEKIEGEIKGFAEVLHKLGDKVKLLRKEIEFLTNVAKKNEEKIMKHEKIIHEINGRMKKLLEILEVDEKDL